MQIRAAVVHDRGAPFQIETVELMDPAPDELIVRVVVSGICQTDVHGREAYYGTPFPCVFGHEGAGVVERVGHAVRSVAPGDHVVMFSPACGDCPPCRQRRPGYCIQARALKMIREATDGLGVDCAHYDLADINRAVEDAASGRTIKAVLRMPLA